jgi:hypothetical protein
MTHWPDPDSEEKTASRFAKDVTSHSLMVEQDEGLFRSMLCKRPDRNTYWFRVLTWPGALAIEGDMGCFVFRRLRDMFEFFRTPSGRINPCYWSEKLTAVDPSGYEGYSAYRFREAAKRQLDEFLEDYDGDASDIRERFAEEVIGRADDGEAAALSRLMRFEIDGQEPFAFAYEIGVREYSVQFLWCLHAILWTIDRYDAAKAPALVEGGVA